MGRTRLAVKRLVLALLVVVVLGALALPAGSVPERHGRGKPRPSTTTTTTTTTTTWPPLPAFDAALSWSDCGDGFQCGTLTVPIDWTGSGPEREAGRSPTDRCRWRCSATRPSRRPSASGPSS